MPGPFGIYPGGLTPQRRPSSPYQPQMLPQMPQIGQPAPTPGVPSTPPMLPVGNPAGLDAYNRTQESSQYRQDNATNFRRSVAVNNGTLPRNAPIAGAPMLPIAPTVIVGAGRGAPAVVPGNSNIISPTMQPPGPKTMGARDWGITAKHMYDIGYSREEIMHMIGSPPTGEGAAPATQPSAPVLPTTQPAPMVQPSTPQALPTPTGAAPQARNDSAPPAGMPPWVQNAIDVTGVMAQQPSQSSPAPAPARPQQAGTTRDIHLTQEQIAAMHTNNGGDATRTAEMLGKYGYDFDSASKLVQGLGEKNQLARTERYVPGQATPLSTLGPSNGMDPATKYGVPRQATSGPSIRGPGTVADAGFPGYTPVAPPPREEGPGIAGAAARNAKPSAVASAGSGQIYHNPDTGQTIRWNGSQWESVR